MTLVQPVNAVHAAILALVLPIAGLLLIIGAIRWGRGDREGLRMLALVFGAVIVVGLGPQALTWTYDAASAVRFPAPGAPQVPTPGAPR